MRTRTKSFRNPMSLSELSTDQLQQRLMYQGIFIVLAGVFMFSSIFFFGPKVGYLFSFISKHRYAQSTDDKAPNTPNFYNIVEATNQKNIDLKGYAEAGITVKIFVNGPERGTAITDSEGTFTFSGLELNEGRNTIFAKAINKDDIESEKSQTINIDYDTKEPELKIESPEKDKTIRNLDNRISVKGSLNEKGTVKVNGSTAVVKGDNTFEILIGAKEGDMEIIVEAFDLAGNKKEEKFNIKYVKGTE